MVVQPAGQIGRRQLDEQQGAVAPRHKLLQADDPSNLIEFGRAVFAVHIELREPQGWAPRPEMACCASFRFWACVPSVASHHSGTRRPCAAKWMV